MTRGFTCMIHVCVHVVHTTCMYVHVLYDLPRCKLQANKISAGDTR